MANILWFKEIHKEDVPIVGGKAANLGEMANNNFPVPPGFVVTTEAFKNYLDETGLGIEIFSILRNNDVDDNDALQNAAIKIQNMIKEEPMSSQLKKEILENYEKFSVNADVLKVAKPALDLIKLGRDLSYVAVRSSATAEDRPNASFAGQQATFLNVKGNNNLIEAVQNCWASLYTARAIYYRVKNNFPHEKVLIAVVIEKQINSQKSGVIFTVNPVTNNKDEIIIEAIYGLGEAIVSGAINPDKYAVNKENLRVISRSIPKKEWMYTTDFVYGKTVRKDVLPDKQEQQALSDFEIRKLSEIAVKLENHYEKPQDIEFAIEGNNLYIVQTRPVTTLHEPKKEETNIEQEKSELEEPIKIEPDNIADILVTGLSASSGFASGIVKIVHEVSDLGKVLKGDVLVTRMTSPDMVPAMQRASAIVTDAGGITSHAAIISREMNIPCIVGTERATQVLKENQEVTVDATKGIVYGGVKNIESKAEIKEQTQIERSEILNIETITEIKAILDLPDNAEKVAPYCDGVGLLRSEFIIAQSGVHPAYLISNGRKGELIDIIFTNVKRIAVAFDTKPVWYRTTDLRSDEYIHLEGGELEEKEDNPMLGWHGIRRSLDQEELLRTEFEAIKKLHDNGFTNVGIMLPMVTDVSQVRRAKNILKEVGLEPQDNIDFGIMAETPASVQIIKELCEEGIDFVSFGTNDLTQFTLAVDRNNEKVQKLYDEMHPAVLRQIKHVIDVCKDYDTETSLCGQAGSRPEMAEFLIKAGIDSITVNQDSISKIRTLAAKIEKKLLLNVARKDFKI